MSISERQKEIKRRRHRRKKLEMYSEKLKKANDEEKALIADKLRALTPGAEVLIKDWNLPTK